MLIWSLALFYVALGTFLVWVGADRLAQAMYDFAQKISHLQFGWLLLAGMIGMCSTHHVAPGTGHVALCITRAEVCDLVWEHVKDMLSVKDASAHSVNSSAGIFVHHSP